MDKIDRKKVIWAMEVLAKCVNDEEVFEYWLVNGPGDGEIDTDDSFEKVDEYYIEDDNFADIMDSFLWLMHQAHKSGGLFTDGIVSQTQEYDIYYGHSFCPEGQEIGLAKFAIERRNRYLIGVSDICLCDISSI